MAESMRAATELQMQVTERTVAWVHDTLGFSYTEIAGAFGTNEQTVRRWAHHDGTPRNVYQHGLDQLREIRYLLERCFRTPALGLAWVHESLLALRGHTPIERLRVGDFDSVLSVLAAMESGTFV